MRKKEVEKLELVYSHDRVMQILLGLLEVQRKGSGLALSSKSPNRVKVKQPETVHPKLVSDEEVHRFNASATCSKG